MNKWIYHVEILRPGADNWAFWSCHDDRSDADSEHSRLLWLETPETQVRTVAQFGPWYGLIERLTVVGTADVEDCPL